MAMSQEIENERRRLAERLEQDVLGSLNLIQAQTESYLQALRGNQQAQLALSVLSSLVQQTMQKARYLQNNLHPTLLETLGLEPALEALAADEERIRGIRLKLQLQRLKERLPTAIEYELFRAVQSLIEQGVASAQVTQISLSLEQVEQRLRLDYADNGFWQNQQLQIITRLSQQLQLHGGQAQGTLRDGQLIMTIQFQIEASSSLTARESEIVQLVAEGRTNKEIAAHLHLSARTVNFHLDNVYSKLGVNSRTEAAMVALQQGWLKKPVK